MDGWVPLVSALPHSKLYWCYMRVIHKPQVEKKIKKSYDGHVDYQSGIPDRAAPKSDSMSDTKNLLIQIKL